MGKIKSLMEDSYAELEQREHPWMKVPFVGCQQIEAVVSTLEMAPEDFFDLTDAEEYELAARLVAVAERVKAALDGEV